MGWDVIVEDGPGREQQRPAAGIRENWYGQGRRSSETIQHKLCHDPITANHVCAAVYTKCATNRDLRHGRVGIIGCLDQLDERTSVERVFSYQCVYLRNCGDLYRSCLDLKGLRT